LTEKDLVVEESMHKSQMSTVLMIDISHSMILYGEDRITPAKKVAMALAELITTRYPKDTLDILVFGNDAWPIKIKDLPYLTVGPYHTNTVAGLQLAMDMLRRKRNTNKQIFMITDGKPSCLRLPDGRYYKNSNGLDDYIVNKCYMMAAQARKLHIPITTFMIASDPYLQQFIDAFTEANQGKAFYTGLQGLGEMIFKDYENNRKSKLR
jgi:Ca-activated chloride channel family protein